ncbi:MAG: HEAT repeat domain-containing protein [Caldilineaceae bacterium]
MTKFFRRLLIPLLMLCLLSMNTAISYAQTPNEPNQPQKVYLPIVAGNTQANQQDSATRQLRYQVGHTYTYQWDVTVQTKSTSKDSQGVHEDGNTSQIKGLVDLQVLNQAADGTYQISLTVHNPTIVASTRDDQATTANDPTFIAALGKPLLFTQASTGEIHEVRYPQDAPSAVVEMQKGIVNALQVTLKAGSQYTAEEQGGQGRYQSHYTVSEDANNLQISKQISANDFTELVSTGDTSAQIQLENRVDMVLDTHEGAPQSIHVVEQIGIGAPADTLQTTAVVTDAVSVETKVVSDGWLRLSQVQKTENNSAVAAAANYVVGSLRATLSDTVTTESEIDLSAVKIDDELQALAQEPTNPILIQRLADLIRQDTSQQILKAVQARLMNPANDQIAGGYIGALSMAATPGAQDVLIDNVLTAASISDTLKAEALTELADLKHPSERLVDTVTMLSQTATGELRSLALLALGGLANASQATDQAAANRMAGDLSTRLQQAQTPEERELLLLAVGNAGNPTTQNTIAPYLSDSNPTVRGAAVLALRKLPMNTADNQLIASLTHDPSAYVQEMAATALTQRTENPALRTAEAEQALQAYAAVTAATVNGVFVKNWTKSFSAGPVTINLPGDLTVKSAPDAPALTLDANQYANGKVMGFGFNLFHAKLLSDVPAGARRVGAYFWIGNNTLVWQDEANVPCSITKNGTLWQGDKQFFNFSQSIPVYIGLVVTLNAQASGHAAITYNYQQQLCTANAGTAAGTITPQVMITAKGSAYLTLLAVRGGVTLQADILKTSLPTHVSGSLSQNGTNPPALGACIDVKATIDPLSGSLAAKAQVWALFFGWKTVLSKNLWSFALNSQNYTLWAQCWPDAPGAFNKTYPASNNATNIPVSINLTWSASSGSSYYLVCIDTTADGLCNGLGDNTHFTRVNGTSYMVNLAPNTTYSWQVRAMGTNGGWTAADGSGQWWTFTTGTYPATFNKTYPANTATNLPMAVNLTWSLSAGASYYLVCIDTTADNLCNGLGDNTNFTRVNGTSYLVNLPASTTYSWQVRAVGANGNWTPGNGSGQWWTFTTGNPPGAFNKTYPSSNNATNIPVSINLTWSASASASYYLVCIDTTADGLCNGLADNTNFTRVNGASYMVNLTPNTFYSWQVRAMGPNGVWMPADGSGQWWTFTTGSYPATFNKTYPGNNATGVPTSINLTWDASAGASYYLVCIDTTADFLCNGLGDNTNFTRVDGTSYFVNLAPGTTYSWQVRAVGANGNWTPGNGAGQWWGFMTR